MDDLIDITLDPDRLPDVSQEELFQFLEYSRGSSYSNTIDIRETNSFNKLISDKIRNIHPEIDVKLKKIKLTIELFELKVLIVTKNPVIEISKNKFLSSNVSKFTDLVSLFTKEETLKKLSSLL